MPGTSADWTAELGHSTAPDDLFGVTIKVDVTAYEVKGDRIKAHIRTERQEIVSDNVCTLDLAFEADVEAP